MNPVEPILVYPDPPPTDVVRALDLSGHNWVTATDVEHVGSAVFAAVVVAVDDVELDSPEARVRAEFARELRQRDSLIAPVLLLVRGTQLGSLGQFRDIFDDFCVTPFHPVEFDARVQLLLARGGRAEQALDVVEYGPLRLNLETYQAEIDNRPLDLTYMEYELLKFLASNPGRVFGREALLSQVWGYDYYGGARTVDVHIRRLRAKLGEQHASLIHTVRSVGYRLGDSRWTG